MVKRFWDKQVIRFLCVGTFNTILDVSLLLTLYKVLGFPEVVANTISVLVAITVSYFLNHRIVFRQKHGYKLSAYLKFLLITGFSAVAIQDTIIFLFTKVLFDPSGYADVSIVGASVSVATLSLLAAKAVGVGIGLVWNFLLYKYVVFGGKKAKDIDQADEIVIAWS